MKTSKCCACCLLWTTSGCLMGADVVVPREHTCRNWVKNVSGPQVWFQRGEVIRRILYRRRVRWSIFGVVVLGLSTVLLGGWLTGVW